MKIKKIYHKITCFLGFHEWQYSYPTNGFHTPQHHRTCTNCQKKQRYDTKGSNICNSNIWMDQHMLSTNHTFFKKIACKLGFHNWNYDNPDHNLHRLCSNCLKEQEYVINGVNGGMNKIWVNCPRTMADNNLSFNTVISNPYAEARVVTSMTSRNNNTYLANGDLYFRNGSIITANHSNNANRLPFDLTLSTATTPSQVAQIAETLDYHPQPNSIQFVEPKKYMCDPTKLSEHSYNSCSHRTSDNKCNISAGTMARMCPGQVEYKEPKKPEPIITTRSVINPIMELEV